MSDDAANRIGFDLDAGNVSVEAPDVPTPVTLRNAFQHPDTHPVVLDVLAIARYKVEWLQWEPEVLYWRINADFNTVASELNLHKLQAMRTLHTVDDFWRRWPVFQNVALALNCLPPDFTTIVPLSAVQALTAAKIAKAVRTDVPWSDELRRYLDVTMLHDGMLVPIEPLDFVHVTDADDYDVDSESIRAAWPQVRASRRRPVAETPNAEQLRRMLDAHAALTQDDAALRTQLKAVGHG